MQFLRITNAAGARTYIPMEAVVQVSVAADAVSAATDYASGRISRGLITQVKYTDGAAAAAPTITVVAAIPAWNGANNLYELICLSPDGAEVTLLSNRTTNF